MLKRITVMLAEQYNVINFSFKQVNTGFEQVNTDFLILYVFSCKGELISNERHVY